MNYIDRIYGTVDIHTPVLLDVMRTRALQRLHGVLQHGISGLLGVTRATTRFEHSVGVMILVRRLGGSLTEQVAALLHDVSHAAFSHVVDYVFDGHDSQSYHEDIQEPYVAASDLPPVLTGHGYDWRQLLDEAAFPLLEQPAPALCADRLDYFLRDSLDLGLATPDQIHSTLAGLVVHDGRIAVADRATARWIGDTYMQADHASWAGFREVGLYEVCAQAIRRALAMGVITGADLWSTDEVVWGRLHSSHDGELLKLLGLVSSATQFIWDDDNPTFRVSTKLRTVDPHVLEDGALVPLSALDAEFAQQRIAYLNRKQGKWPMRVVSPESQQ